MAGDGLADATLAAAGKRLASAHGDFPSQAVHEGPCGGVHPCPRLRTRSAYCHKRRSAGVRTCLGVGERNLRDEDAAATLAGIAVGHIARCLLPFIPLMRGGAEPGIIAEWKTLAQAEPDPRRRSDYGGLALVFAGLTDCRPLWKRALQGWNVEQSQQVLEWQAIAEKRGLARAPEQRM